jgi:hypothetical protein
MNSLLKFKEKQKENKLKNIKFKNHCLRRVKQCDILMQFFRTRDVKKYYRFQDLKNYYLLILINMIKKL